MTVPALLGLALILIAAVAIPTAALRRGQARVRARAMPAPPPADRAFTRESEFRHVLGLLTHELRTPLGAIVGYDELLADGLLGELSDRSRDAVRRIGTSAAQMRHLIDGLADLMIPEQEVTLDLQQVDGAAAAGDAAESARSLAAGRSVRLEVSLPAQLPELITDNTRLSAALDLALGAAVRASPGATLALSFSGEEGALEAVVEGTALDAARDRPQGDADAITTGAGLRLAMAARIATILGGTLALEGHGPTTLRLRIPSAPIDAYSPPG